MEDEIEYLVDDTPVDISHYSDEEIERRFKELFGDAEDKKQSKSEE